MQDRDGGLRLLSSLGKQFPLLAQLFADGADAGPLFHDGLPALLPHLARALGKRSDAAQGFVVLPQRWIVERTIAGLPRCRSLAKDYWKTLPWTALPFLKLASLRLMLRKLCNPSSTFETDSQRVFFSRYER